MFAVPAIFEVKSLLTLWLGQVPDGAVLFACAFIIMQTVDQLSQGLGIANRAMGHIGEYTLMTYTPKLLILPLGWYILKLNYPLYYLVALMVALEYFCMLLRIFLFRDLDGFNVSQYCRNVLLKTIIPVVLSSVGCFLLCMIITSVWRFVLTFIISITIFLISTYFLSLNVSERELMKVLIKRIFTFLKIHK